ncbi:Vascular endothelial growth factor like protein [Dufourea novaeangliae]|uniref:Vascular endothelial growth factor like protein n=1 Tax=Dufourea novaeangliae TaxID=178035 RepID=A0A154PRY9_DUFNO|nr:Vascular endothelial growth factor like protein [Dufourea novaeangliae]
MTRYRRLLVLSILLMAYGLFVVDARHRQHEDTANDARHRHRHRHESIANRRNRHDLADRRSTWSQELDYLDYDARLYYERSYPRSAKISLHGRMFEPSYPAWYHRGGGYRGTGWYDEDDEKRRGSSRHGWRSYRQRSDRNHHKVSHSRNRDPDYDSGSDDVEREKTRGPDENSFERHHSWWKNGRKHRIGSRRDWHPENENSEDYEYHEDEDYEYREDEDDDTDKNEEDDDDTDKDEEDDDAWKETDENRTEDDEEFDNDFYKNDTKPPLKTYDDIIRRLTSEDPTTARTTVKRDYRNIAVDRYATKRNAFGNFKMVPRNISRPLVHGKTLSVDRQEKKARLKMDDAQAKTKSLEQDYDEYPNTTDNEKEEDLIKAGVEEDTDMQADVTNADYTENEDEDETSTTTTTTTTSTTTTTTTTTPKPTPAQNYDYRDPRTYDSGTGAQYNGYQAKNDYPSMSGHSVHKWQSLGTRESVKETRSNMQQYNKNGKTAEIREALQHAIKVSREGSCQWPRPRVIPVRDVYPSPSTTYIPHCAILHRCSDDTGCCRSEALTCVPKHSHRVELSFYTTNVGGGSVVEKLSFYNHTECECRERTEYDTTNEKPSEQRVYRHYQPSPQPQNMRRAQPRKPCRCPSEFTPRITPEGECQCNCYENHQNCIKIRRGKGYFSLADRLCIQNEECAAPSCEFGEYMRRQGKCPRKKDKFDAIVNFRTNLSHRYRS